MISSFNFYVLIISMLIGSRILGIDMDDGNEGSIPLDEGSNGSFGEADDMSDIIPDFNDPAEGVSDDGIDEELMIGYLIHVRIKKIFLWSLSNFIRIQLDLLVSIEFVPEM